MLGQISPPDQNTSPHLHVDTEQVFLCQDVFSQSKTRCLWAGLGFVVVVLIGVSASGALHPCASNTSAEALPLVPGVGFNPVHAFIPSGIGPFRLPGSGPTSNSRGIGPTAFLPSALQALPGWRPAGAELSFNEDGLPQWSWCFGDEYFDSLTAAKRRAKEILQNFAGAECDTFHYFLPDAEFRIIYDIIQRHPNRVRKRTGEVARISVAMSEKFRNTPCFWIWRSDGSREDISLNKCFATRK